MSSLSSVSDLLSGAWAGFKERKRSFITLTACMLLAAAAYVGGVQLAAQSYTLTSDYLSFPISYSEWTPDMVAEHESMVTTLKFGGALLGIAGFILMMLIGMGINRTALSAPGTPTIQLFKEGVRRFFPAIGTTILLNIAVGLGILLFIIPGIYLTVAFSFAMLLVVRGSGPIESLRHSRELVRGRWWAVLGRMLVISIITALLMLPAIVLLIIAMQMDYNAGMILTIIAGIYAVGYLLVIPGWELMYAKLLLDSAESTAFSPAVK